MNGIHDMGGMHGFGPISPEPNEPVFHHPWERRVWGMHFAMNAWRKWPSDRSRFSRERIPPATYLRMSYFELWFAGLIDRMVEAGLVTREEVRSGRPAPGAARATPPIGPEKMIALHTEGRPTTRDVQTPPRFQPGDRVHTRNLHPAGHTRLPRYARGKTGVIVSHHGAHVFPDTNAAGQGEQPHPLYTVRFTARELWGEAAPARDTVHLDLWERYLEPI